MTPRADGPLKRGRGKKRFLYRQLSDILRRKIRSGSYKPGERIPSMDDLCDEFGLNKATVRSALAELAAEGILYSVPAQGTFVADEPARMLRRPARRTLTVGVISMVMIPNDTGPFHLELLESIRERLHTLSANLLILPTALVKPERNVLRMIDDAALDALIAVGPFERTVLRHIGERQLPSVLIDYLAPGLDVDTVTMDNRGGGYLAMQHLISLGHERTAVVAGDERRFVTAERLKGAQQALQEAGRPESSTVIFSDYTTIGGHKAMTKLLQDKDVPTAVFCMNDEMAAGALQAIAEHGRLSVPKDISIIGFDDITLASLVSPALTTMRVPKSEMAQMAVERLQGRLKGSTSAVAATTLATKLIVRTSTAAPKR